MNAASLPILLRALRLPTIAREHEKAIGRAEAENWGYAPDVDSEGLFWPRRSRFLAKANRSGQVPSTTDASNTMKHTPAAGA